MKSSNTWLAALASLVMMVGATTARAADAEPLTPEDVGTKLEQLGFEHKALKNKDGKVVEYQVSVRRDGRSWNLYVGFTGDKRKLAVTAFCAKLPNPTPPPMVVLKLLELNSGILPAFFGYDKTGNMFFIRSVLINKGISNADLKETLEHVAFVLDKTQELWNPKAWPAEEGPGTPPAASAPAGNAPGR